MKITYRKSDGTNHTPVTHGDAPGPSPPKLTLTSTFCVLSSLAHCTDYGLWSSPDNEVVVKISGRAASSGDHKGVLQLRFVILNRDTGSIKISGPFFKMLICCNIVTPS